MNAIRDAHISNIVDGNGNPTGGAVVGVGLTIQWQDGPLGRCVEGCGDGDGAEHAQGCQRRRPNGAFVETVISSAIQRIEFYQKASGGKFSCRENSLAITKLEEALHWLEARTASRESRQVEGTHTA